MKSLLLTIGAVALTAMTINATASDTLLSPRAAGNQIKQVAGTTVATTPVAAAAISPRAAGNQICSVAGTSSDVNPAVACAKSMNGTPKTIQACVEHSTMPGCTVAAAK